MQLKCPGFSSLSITTDIRYGSAFQRKLDETPLKKKKRMSATNQIIRVQVNQSLELPVLRVRQVLGEQTQTSQTGTRKEGIPNQGLSCCRVSEPSSTTQFRSYRWSLAVRYRLRDLSLYCHGGFFFFFQMPQRQFLTDAHVLFFLSVHLSSTFSNLLELTGVISWPYVCAKLLAAFAKVMRFSGITELERPASNHTLRAGGTRRMQDGPWSNLPHDVKAAAAQQNHGGIRSVLSKSL